MNTAQITMPDSSLKVRLEMSGESVLGHDEIVKIILVLFKNTHYS